MKKYSLDDIAFVFFTFTVCAGPIAMLVAVLVLVGAS